MNVKIKTTYRTPERAAKDIAEKLWAEITRGYDGEDTRLLGDQPIAFERDGHRPVLNHRAGPKASSQGEQNYGI